MFLIAALHPHDQCFQLPPATSASRDLRDLLRIVTGPELATRRTFTTPTSAIEHR